MGEHGLAIQLNGNKDFDKTKFVHVSARQHGKYRWLEAWQAKDQVEDRVILSRLLIDESGDRPRLWGKWQGIERQMLSDFIEGKVGKEELAPFLAFIDSGQAARLFWHKGKNVRVVLRSTVFSQSECVVVAPYVDDDKGLCVSIFKMGRGKPSALAIFEPGSVSFTTRTLDETSRKPSGYWTPENTRAEAWRLYESEGDLNLRQIRSKRPDLAVQITKYPGGIAGLRQALGISEPKVNIETGRFVDKDNISWILMSALAREIGHDFATVKRALEAASIPFILGRGGNNKKVKMYRESEVVSLLALEQQAMSEQEADQWLKELIGL
ncbi:MAG: hypothetical protein HY376_00345 [Candidatus Blackburnbacteria bacterium]|nr:hypothetical protein [Candidatus Blackburnbacteria bacterium]